jgi:hypothetical protein
MRTSIIAEEQEELGIKLRHVFARYVGNGW